MTWKQRLFRPLGIVGVLAVAAAAWAVAEIFVLTEDDPPAEAETFHNCEMHISNQLNEDLQIVSKEPTSSDRWGTDDPPALVKAKSSASLDFKFRSSTKKRYAQTVYETVQDVGVPLQVTMSWACKDETLGTQAAVDGKCTHNGLGDYYCDPLELPDSGETTTGYNFQLSSAFGD
jgi:hypothetical protein